MSSSRPSSPPTPSLRQARSGELPAGARAARYPPAERSPSRTPSPASPPRRRPGCAASPSGARSRGAAREGGRAGRCARAGVLPSSQSRQQTARDRPSRRLRASCPRTRCRIRARNRARRRLRRARCPRRAPTGSSSSPTTRRTGRRCRARRRARPVPRADRRDGRAEDAVRYRRHRLVERTLALLDDDAVVVCFEPRRPGFAPLRPGCGRCSTSVRVSIRRGRARCWAAGLEDRRATPRALRSAARRPGDHRLHGQRAGTHARAGGPRRRPASSRTDPGRHWHVLGLPRQAEQPRTLVGDVREDAAPDRERLGPRGRHVGDQARPAGPLTFRRVTGPRNVCEITSPATRRRTTSPPLSPPSSSASGRIRTRHGSPAVRPRASPTAAHPAVVDLARLRRRRSSPRGGSSCR